MAQGPHEKTIFADDLLSDPSTIICALLQSEPLMEQCEESGPHAFLHRPHATFLSLHLFLVLLLSVHMHLFFFSSPLPFFCGEGENILLKTSVLANKLRDKITTLTHPKTIN